tara:strand:+ start:1021 stop:1920 length:900 start_codon:yes stop_codon:yes gene_type:complete
METFDIGLFEYRQKIAAFDYDHTLVKPHKGTFSRNVDDWIWIRENVPTILKQLYKNNYAIVIFTNQSKSFKVEQIKHCLTTLELPIRVYIGLCEKTKKPNSHMWDEFHKPSIDKNMSFFVGDALGRIGDWADSDKIFGEKIGLALKSPEEMFPFPKTLENTFTSSNHQEFIMMMGYPGSGKTTFVLNEIPDTYIKLHGDILKTDAKKKKSLRTEFIKGNSVVLDSTNPSKEKRQIFIDIAKEYNVPCRLIHINNDFELSKYRNSNREIRVPIMALYIYRKKYQIPELNEGFKEIVSIQN